jgi:hypothetical protein
LEQELAQLRSQHKQAAADKHNTDLQLADTKASLLALQEKVCMLQPQECWLSPVGPSSQPGLLLSKLAFVACPCACMKGFEVLF